MTNLLLKLFVKNHQDTTSNKTRESVGKFASTLGILLNFLLATCKIVAGAFLGVISVLADGLNNLTDCASNVVSLISFKLAGKPADKEHPYGHQRLEYVASMIVAFLVFVLAFELGTESVNKIFHPQQTEMQGPTFVLTVVALSLSILVKFWMFLFNRKLGKTYNSELLLATSTDAISDVASTTAVLVSLLLAKFLGWQTDGVMGLVVSVLIAIAGIGIFSKTMSSILGEAPDKQLINSIVERIKAYPGVYGIHDLNVHNYGPNKYYATVHVEVDSSVPVLDSHDMIDCIERDFAEHTNILLVIHLDPVVIGDEELDNYKQVVQNVVEGLDKRFTIHDFRMVKGTTHTNLIFDVAIPFDTKLKNHQIADYIQQEVAKLYPTVYVVPTVEYQLEQ